MSRPLEVIDVDERQLPHGSVRGTVEPMVVRALGRPARHVPRPFRPTGEGI